MNEKRHTFEVPEGYEAVRDAEGRATGELRPVGENPAPQAHLEAREPVPAYVIGDKTMDQVFHAAGISNVLDLQSILDAVEKALPGGYEPGVLPEPKRVLRKIELWFFRDLLNDQRLKLIQLFGFKPDETTPLHTQKRLLDVIFRTRGDDVIGVEDFQLLERLSRDNTPKGARPVIESGGWEQALRLGEQGLIAIEQLAVGGRLHITRKGERAVQHFIEVHRER